MRKTLLLFLFSVALGCINAQERLFFDHPCEGITTDLQGNVFVTHGATLGMFSANDAKRLNYSEPTHGDITNVDAGIASKILVFYRESGTITLLNNELAPIGKPLNLLEKSLTTVNLVAMGNPNKIVLYDDANQDLLITDLSLNVLSRTHITFPDDFHPTDMQVVPEHRIALLDTLHGICLFDFFGTFEREIPIPGIKAMQLMKDQIIYLKNETLYLYTLPSETTSMNIQSLEIKVPVKAFHVWKNHLYFIDNLNFVYKSQSSPLSIETQD